MAVNYPDTSTSCRYCQTPILSTDYFCPNCGKKLKDKPQSTTMVRQIFVYLLSALLPPLGLWPAVKYLRQTDAKSKQIGWTAIALTILSIVITLWLTFRVITDFNQALGDQLILF